MCYIIACQCRMLKEMMLILALTREKFYWLWMLLPDGIPSLLPSIFILFFFNSILWLWSNRNLLIFGKFATLTRSTTCNVSRLEFWGESSPLCFRDTICSELLFIYYCLCFLDCDSGMTNSNYTELNQLYEKYKDLGLYSKLKLFRKPIIQ